MLEIKVGNAQGGMTYFHNEGKIMMKDEMDAKLVKINRLFTRKTALREALQALEKEQEVEIREQLQLLFKELKDSLMKSGFFISIYSHYSEMGASIIKNLDTTSEQNIKIVDYKIDSLKGSNDEEFEEVIKITKEFLKRFE